MDRTIRVAIVPNDAPGWLAEAVRSAGGVPSEPEAAIGLIWYGHQPGELRETLRRAPGIRWVQIAWAGVEDYRTLMNDGRLWTCAKSVYGENVAEHALALILASFREIPRLARERRWSDSVGRRLFGSRITIVGAGGITAALLSIMKPFRVTATIVRKHAQPLRGVTVVGREELEAALASADIVVLACSLTPETTGMIGAAQLAAMPPHALLVNVARGRLIQADALVSALNAGKPGGAALDVTEPEPLPEGHPLWSMDNVLITPHSANPDEHGQGPLEELLVENVRRFIAGRSLLGRVDTELGY